VQYERGASPGNGVYLASRSESGTARLSYTAIRKLNFGIDGGYYSLSSLGQNLQKDWAFTGGSGLTYELVRTVYLTARYDNRHQAFDLGGHKQNAHSVTFGIGFSPGNIPLSLW
jgi:hypothetical protein